MKQMAKHIALSTTQVFRPGLFDEWTATMLLLLTPNAPMSGAEVRSTKASAPLAGYASRRCSCFWPRALFQSFENEPI